jgi:hypothetical protein
MLDACAIGVSKIDGDRRQAGMETKIASCNV